MNESIIPSGTNDTVAIQNALNNGGIIKLTNGLFLASNLQMNTDNTVLITENATLKLINGANTHLITINADHCKLLDANFDGNKANQSGGTPSNRSDYAMIFINCTATNTLINKCFISNNYFGAAIINCATNTKIVNNTITDSGINASESDAIYNSSDARYTLIDGNFIQNSMDFGIAFDSNDIKVVNNTVLDSSTCGIGAAASTFGSTLVGSNILVQGNTIINCQSNLNFYSMNSTGFSNIEICSNKSINSTFHGIDVILGAGSKSGNNINIHDNTVINCSQSGIVCASGEKVNIHDNYIECSNDTLRNGILIDACSDTKVNNNEILYADFGIVSTNSNNVQLGSNSFNSLQRDGIQINLGYNVYITNTIFKDIPRRALFIYNANNIFLEGIKMLNCNNPSHSEGGAAIFFYENNGVISNIYLDNFLTNSCNSDLMFLGNNFSHIRFGRNIISDKQYSSMINVEIADINYKTTIPTAGTWKKGEEVYNFAAGSSGRPIFRCVTSGTPGTWQSYGALS